MTISLWQKLKQYPAVLWAVLAVLVIGAAIVYSISSSKPGQIIVAHLAYFSADDGKTFFADNANKPSPYKSPNGGEVLRACVFSCDGKRLFVGYLERDDGGGATITEPGSAHPTSDPMQTPGPLVPGSLGSKRIKRPGDKTWTPITTVEGLRIISVRCPNGDAAARMSPPE